MVEDLKKILFVDDDELLSEFATMAMESEGKFEVQYCKSGAEALEQAPIFKPQLIIMDIQMPEMDGVATSENLRKIPETEHTPLIFLTGLAKSEDECKYDSEDVLGLISKPFEPAELCDKIKKLWAEK